MFLAKIETSFVFDFAFKGLFFFVALYRYFCFYSFLEGGRDVLGVVLVDLYQGFG